MANHLNTLRPGDGKRRTVVRSALSSRTNRSFESYWIMASVLPTELGA